MSKQLPPDGERVEKVEIVFELPPSPQGTYQYERGDGTVVRGDASGEWMLGEDGDVEDIVFFASPRLLGYGPKSGTKTTNTEHKYVVEIVEDETGDVVWRSKPTTHGRAEKIEDGTSINLNWEKFSTRIEEHDGEEA